MSQQKDSDPEEYKRLHSEKEAHLKRIQQLTEESARLKTEVARWGIVFTFSLLCPTGSFSATSPYIFTILSFLSIGPII